MAGFNPQTEELVELKSSHGGASDPMGTGLVGAQSTVNLGRSAILGRPQVRYRDFLLEVDVYAAPGLATRDGRPGLEVHFYCPRCRNICRVTSDRKAIDFVPRQERDPQTGQMVARGELSIEPMKCAWELAGDERRMQFGLGLCNLAIAIDKNIAKDA